MTSRTATKPSASAKTKAVTPRPAPVVKEAAKGAKPVPPTRAAQAKSADALVLKSREKVKKPKLVRDSFTMPKAEYAAIEAIKLRAGMLSTSAKKSEILRAGIKALSAMTDSALLAALAAVPALKTGRPRRAKA